MLLIVSVFESATHLCELVNILEKNVSFLFFMTFFWKTAVNFYLKIYREIYLLIENEHVSI